MTFNGQSTSAVVHLASANGESLMLIFQAILGGYVGSMPVLWDGDRFRDLITRGQVDIARV